MGLGKFKVNLYRRTLRFFISVEYCAYPRGIRPLAQPLAGFEGITCPPGREVTNQITQTLHQYKTS